jgi:serine/threonine protein kinase/tetratricopeptide (TPR) repeat protein
VAVKCPKCHSENPETKQFCADCGTQLPFSKDIHPEVTETLQTPIHELTTGSTFASRYQIIEELGKGGMGKVYKVFDTEIKEKIALKLIKSDISVDHETIERFRNELKFARKIRHKNVCQMFDLAKEEGSYYITMEYVHGEDLKRLIRKMGQLSPGQAILIAKQVCEGLAEAHKLGVVHRDLKPQNIMVDEEGNARIMDFGIARSLKIKGITGAGVMIGTPEYMSPEQVEGKDVDQRSDIYSLGIILYELVTGRVPFEGETPFTIGVKQKSEIPKNPKQINPNIPEDLSGIILKCLEKDKTNRYQTAGEVRSELEKIEKGIPTTERIIPEKKAFTSKEITVTFGLKKVLLPILGLAFLIIAAIVIWQIFSKKEAAPAASAKKSIAVLPFVDLSPAKEYDYLCEGIAETLINALSSVKDLHVPGRTSTFSFKGKDLDVREIGQKLNVETVLEGSVQVSGDRLRVTARLTSVDDGYQLWSDNYNQKIDDIFAIQDDIAQKIMTVLKIELLGEKQTQLVKHYTENRDVYNLYLKGRYYWNKREKDDNLKSIEYFQEAVNKDPSYALGYSSMGMAYVTLGSNTFFPPKEVFPKAKEAALKALEIDPNLDEAHIVLGAVLNWYERDFSGSEREYRRAIDLNPSNADTHHWYAFLLIDLGRNEEAIKEILLARELDPLAPRKNADLGEIFFRARDYPRAVEELKKSIELFPEHSGNYLRIAHVYLQMGKYKDAIEAILPFARQQDFVPTLAYAYALSGKKKKAQEILGNIIRDRGQQYFSAVQIAQVYVALGDKKQAFYWLGKALAEVDCSLCDFKIHPQLDPLRSDPRFTALLKKVGLEK